MSPHTVTDGILSSSAVILLLTMLQVVAYHDHGTTVPLHHLGKESMRNFGAAAGSMWESTCYSKPVAH